MAQIAAITADTVVSQNIGTAYKAVTFAIPQDMNSHASWVLFGNLADQGLEGAIAGVTNQTTQETPEERDNRKAREKLSLALLQIELDQMIEALESEIEEVEQLIITLTEEIEELQQKIEPLNAAVEELKAELVENHQDCADIDALYEKYNQGLRRMLGPEARSNLDALLQKEQEFITVRAELPGIDGPRRYIVFKDEDGRYYINDPHTQDKLLIDDLPQAQMKLFGETMKGQSFSMMNDIRMQEAQGRKLGNQATIKDAESFYTAQEKLAGALAKMGENNVNIIFGYRDTLRYLEIEKFNIIQDRKEIERQIQVYEDKLAKNAAKLASKHSELAEAQEKLSELKQRLTDLNERKERLDQQYTETKNMNATSGGKIQEMFNEAANLYAQNNDMSLDEIAQQIKLKDTSNGKILSTVAMQMFEVHQRAVEKQAELSQVQQNVNRIDKMTEAFANRHEFLQSLYGEGPGQWALDNLADWMIELGALTADDKVKQAWENPITLNGKGVYRDNETLKLYTYDETTQTRTYIENAAIISELEKRANVDGELYMNETPNSQDPENGFVDTFKALLAADKLRKAIKSVEMSAEFNALAAKTEAAELAQKHGVNITFPAARHEDAGQLSSTYNNDANTPTNAGIISQEQGINDAPTTNIGS